MPRTNVYEYPTYDDTDGPQPGVDYTPRVVGWFDVDRAELIKEDTRWDGNNMVSLATGERYGHQCLYRTAGGRWVLNNWSQRQGSASTYEFVDNDAARAWLITNNRDEDVAKYFGELEEERGPGRPEIGPEVKTRLPADIIAALDVMAAAKGVTRAELLRDIVSNALVMLGEVDEFIADPSTGTRRTRPVRDPDADLPPDVVDAFAALARMGRKTGLSPDAVRRGFLRQFATPEEMEGSL
jgi:hypothetical protein